MFFKSQIVLLLLSSLLLQLGDGGLHVLDVLLQDGVLLLELNGLQISDHFASEKMVNDALGCHIPYFA